MHVCNYCEKNGFIHVQDVEELLFNLTELLEDSCLDSVSIVADEDITRELLYYAVNDDYAIKSVMLDHYNYDDAYITTITAPDPDEESDYSVDIEKAIGEKGVYLASDCLTFIQYDIPCKCQYIEDVMNNKYIEEFDPQFFAVGDVDVRTDEDNASKDGVFTYASHVDGKHSSGDILVQSTSKEFIDVIRKIFSDDSLKI